MALALTLKEQNYILECDRELEPQLQTTFKLKPLSAKVFSELQDLLKIETHGERIANIGSYTHQVLMYGLVGWDNLKDENDNVVVFTTNKEDNLDKLSPLFRSELANAILEMSSLKN